MKKYLILIIILIVGVSFLKAQNCNINLNGNRTYSSFSCSTTPNSLNISQISNNETFTFDVNVTISGNAIFDFNGNGSTLVIATGVTVRINGDLNFNGSSGPKSFIIEGTLIINGNFNAQNNVTYGGSGLIQMPSNRNWQNNGPGSQCASPCNLSFDVGTCMNSSSPICQAVATYALPIELISFTAEAQSESIFFQWVTATEVNNDYFTIEYSEDGKNFSVLTTVKGAGNSAEPKSYELVVPFTGQGLYYFRLRQTDFDGKSSHSSLISLEWKTNLSSVWVVRNPAQTAQIHIKGKLEEPWRVLIMDMMGKVLYNQSFDAPERGELDQLIVLPTSQNHGGLYLIQLFTNSQNKVFRL